MTAALLALALASLADGGTPEADAPHAAVAVDGGAVAFPPMPAAVAAPEPAPPANAEPATPLRVFGAVEADLGVLPSGLPENGLDLFSTVRAIAGFSVGEAFTLELAPTFRFRLIDTPGFNREADVGGFLRGADWDELSDFGHILSQLRIAPDSSPFFIRVAPVRKKTLGLGHLLWRYSNQENADYRPAAGRAVLQVGPVRGEFFASDILGARIFAGELAWDLGGTFSSDATVKDRYVLALQVAHDANLAGRPFRADRSVPALTLPSVTLLHLDASAVLARSAALRWLVLGGVGTRVNETADLGLVVGTAVDANAGDLGFSTRLELRKQTGGFRHGFFGPGYELQRFSDIGLGLAPLADVRLPDSFSGFAELRVGLGERLSAEIAAEYFFWNRLDLDAGLQLSIIDERLQLTARFTALGLAQTPRFAAHGGFRLRVWSAIYVLAQAGTVFFPQPDGGLIRGFAASAGAGVDFER
jgi:hypothetical protein